MLYSNTAYGCLVRGRRALMGYPRLRGYPETRIEIWYSSFFNAEAVWASADHCQIKPFPMRDLVAAVRTLRQATDW